MKVEDEGYLLRRKFTAKAERFPEGVAVLIDAGEPTGVIAEDSIETRFQGGKSGELSLDYHGDAGVGKESLDGAGGGEVEDDVAQLDNAPEEEAAGGRIRLSRRAREEALEAAEEILGGGHRGLAAGGLGWNLNWIGNSRIIGYADFAGEVPECGRRHLPWLRPAGVRFAALAACARKPAEY